MITKEKFCEIITRLRKSSDLVDRVDGLFRESMDNVENDFMNAASLQISHEGIVIDLLCDMMEDTGEDISYFVYELDYGRKYKPGTVTCDGEDIDFSTPEALYDYLIQNMKKE